MQAPDPQLLTGYRHAEIDVTRGESRKDALPKFAAVGTRSSSLRQPRLAHPVKTVLEQQAALPITNPFEMGSASIADAVSGIAADQDYHSRFMQAFGRGVNEQDTLQRLARDGVRSPPMDCMWARSNHQFVASDSL